MDVTTSANLTYTDSATIGTNLTLSNLTSSKSTIHRDEGLARAEVFVQSVILVLAVLGNSIVIMSLILRRRPLTRMHVLMIHLSLADLFVAFCSVLPQLAWDVTFVFKGGDSLCRLVKYMQVVAIYASSYVLLTTAVDRYVAICHPLLSHRCPANMVHMLVLAAWFLSLLFSIPQIFIFSFKLNRYGLYDCWATFDPQWTLTLYITIFTCLVYIIPTIILVYCYSSICLAVWKSGKADMKQVKKILKEAAPNEHSASLIRATSDHDNKIFAMDVHNDHNNTRTVLLGAKHGNKFRTNISRNNAGVLSLSNSIDDDNNTITQSLEELNEARAYANSCNGASHKCAILSHTRGKRMPNHLHDDERIAQANGAKKRSSGSGISRAKMKTIKLTMTVVICYLACWSPFFIAQMWAGYDDNAPFNGSAYTIILLLASLNSCTNPWIYLIYSDIFFSCFKELVSRVSYK